MSWLEALVLGLVQGLTEFLPISSSGHLEIGSVLLQIKTEENLLFAVVVHLATALATIVVFKEDIRVLVTETLKLRNSDSLHFNLKILLSMLPVFFVGIFFKDTIESLFVGNMLLVGSMLLVTGILLLFAHYKKSGNLSVSYLSAFVIGIAQAFAILPGISRSGATISTALLLGVERSRAAKFSFLMVLIPIFGASILQLKDYFDAAAGTHPIAMESLVVGFIGAFVSGFVACKWMIRIVRKGKLTYFAFYCFIVGTIAIIFSL